jgi:hypothetical protein
MSGVDPKEQFQELIQTQGPALPGSIITKSQEEKLTLTLSTTLLGLSTLLNSLLGHSPGLAILGLHTREIV